MEGAAARFGFHFHSPRSIAAVLRTVIRGQNLDLGDGFGVWIDVQRRVAAVIHVVAAIHLPVVVLRAPAVNCVGYVAVHTNLALIRTGLADDTWGEVHKLGKVATV